MCIGHGLDASAIGLLASIVLPSVIGLIIWVIFAILRPRFRQVYALREWFVQQDIRPKPLSSSWFAFLFPHTSFVPSMPSDVSDAGKSARTDDELFLSDEQLNQRALWIAFLIALGWTVLGLVGVLPLYMVSLPCLADSSPMSVYGGSYSTLQDLSLTRLLRAIESGNIPTSNLIAIQKRDASDPQNLRVRVIILTTLALVFGLLPALWKIIREFNGLVAHRNRWLEVKCNGLEMAWLSATRAPGFVGWGEKRLKDFILKSGLSSSLDKNGRNGQRRRSPDQQFDAEEKARLEVDIESLFSIVETDHLALLINERDEILENLEIAETRYINSFRLSTPDPSIADFMATPQDSTHLKISRPRPLNSKRGSHRRRRTSNPALASSSLAPMSFVAPYQYYKLGGVHGVTGGRFADSTYEFSDSVNSRVVGSRFQEMNRDSTALDSQLPVDESGRLVSSTPSTPSIPDPRRYGPNHDLGSSEEEDDGLQVLDEEDEWVELNKDTITDLETDFNGTPPSSRRRHKLEASSSTKRETFPFRKKNITDPDELPPHLRLQPSQPFVRPLDGINHDHLGGIYTDITNWRTKLKAINAEISDAQQDAYNDIADGARIKGWLMVGRGLRYLPGTQLIEGRSKDDVQWHVLQHERPAWDTTVMWTIITVITVFLAAGLTAAVGLALATAPNESHYFPFLHALVGENTLAAGLATILAPAVAASFFIILALVGVHWLVHVHGGSVSISGAKLLVFKIIFTIIAIVATLWLVTVGALLFALQAFSTSSGEASSVADGSIYLSVLALALIMQVAIIAPGLLLLRPVRLWNVMRFERHAVTPRQKFRAVYPQVYDPSYTTGACVLAIVFASTFSLIFPLLAPAVVVLLFMTLIAHRFIVGYNAVHSRTGGLLQIWLLRRFGTLLALQPILLGLIFLSRRFYIEGGVLVGAGVAVAVFVEVYTVWKMGMPGRRSLSAITQDSLNTFQKTAKSTQRRSVDEESTSLVSTAPGARTRGSMASVLEMMSLTLAVMPSPSPSRGPLPLVTETLDDSTATERAARTHPETPPHLPPLPFTDHAEEMAGILYAPELLSPPPVIWLPNDASGVARSEAVDLQKYHGLRVTLDVRTAEDVLHLRPA